MKVLKRIKEAGNKLIFCYTATKNLSSFLSLIWFTKIYRFSKRTPPACVPVRPGHPGVIRAGNKAKSYSNKFFSISLTAFPDRNIFLRTYVGDIDIFYEIFLRRIYELPYISNKQVIIDAGANVGFAALYFLHLMPDAIIYCVEPDPDNFIFLQRNLQAEITSGKVIPVQAALSDKDGSVNLKKSPLKYNTGITEESVENPVQVITYSVTTFLEKFNIEKVDLFKIDIEGAEQGIFKADTSWLRNVGEVIIEFHSEKIKRMCFEKLISKKFNFQPHVSRMNTDVFHFNSQEKFKPDSF
ncbi:MAG TPA: FkbM family methyltransferase [Hanamia sp.]